MLNYTLGTIEASEALIKDLYIDLRAKVNAWSKITQQTPQARMGYVGQHLYYYHLKSRSGIDLAISRALSEKRNFNETKYVGSYKPKAA